MMSPPIQSPTIVAPSHVITRLSGYAQDPEMLEERLSARDARIEQLRRQLNENASAMRERANERTADVAARRLRLLAAAKRNALERVIVVNERVLAHSDNLDRRLSASRAARARLAEAVRERRRDLDKMRELVSAQEEESDFFAGGSLVLEPFRPSPVLVPSEIPSSMAISPYIEYDARHEDGDEDEDEEGEDEAERARRIIQLQAQVAELRARLGNKGQMQCTADPGFPIYCDTPLRPRLGSPRVAASGANTGRALQALDNLEC